MSETEKLPFKTQDASGATIKARHTDSGTTGAPEEYEYRSAGIRERHGIIPAWLILVALGLVIWGIYYMVTYWRPIHM